MSRSEPILQLEAVSKCKKQRSNNARKAEFRKFIKNIQLVEGLDHDYQDPQPEQPAAPSTAHLRDMEPDYYSRDFENSNLTKHIAEQLLIIKIMMMIMVVLAMILARLGEDVDTIIHDSIGFSLVLAMHTLITITMILMAVMKHIKTRELTLKQLIKFSPYQVNLWGLNPAFLAELVFLCVHPNLLTVNIVIHLKQPVYQQYSALDLNHLLQIIMLCRIYLVYSAMVSSTIYLSTRGNRICRIYGTKCNLYFGFKCLFNTRPLFFLVVIFVTTLFVFGEMVRLSEEGVGGSELGSFGNSLWCVMITMGTVGYGDYVPKTYLGRMLLFFSSITGIIIASLLILTLSRYLTMEMSENKAHITLQRLVLREKLEELAKGVMLGVANISKLRTSAESEQPLKQLKKRTDDVKYTLRKIKNLIDTDNINEEMDRLFECLEDNMKDAYINQTRYAEALQFMYEAEKDTIEEMKFSFTEEIQNIIKDR